MLNFSEPNKLALCEWKPAIKKISCPIVGNRTVFIQIDVACAGEMFFLLLDMRLNESNNLLAETFIWRIYRIRFYSLVIRKLFLRLAPPPPPPTFFGLHCGARFDAAAVFSVLTRMSRLCELCAFWCKCILWVLDEEWCTNSADRNANEFFPLFFVVLILILIHIFWYELIDKLFYFWVLFTNYLRVLYRLSINAIVVINLSHFIKIYRFNLICPSRARGYEYKCLRCVLVWPWVRFWCKNLDLVLSI